MRWLRRPKRALGETPRSIRAEYLEKWKPRKVRVERTSLPPPVLMYLGGNRWRLGLPYRFRHVVVPGWFVFDLASVPRILWSVIAPFELSIVAPLVHDWLYRYGHRFGFTREQADDLFYEVMELEGVAAWRRTLAYRAVRWFGGSSWRG